MHRPATSNLSILPADRPRARTALVLAVLLMLAQMLLVLHQLEHVGTQQDGDTCDICLVGHGLDHASVATVQILSCPDVSPASPLSGSLSAQKIFFAAYRSRAPPSA